MTIRKDVEKIPVIGPWIGKIGKVHQIISTSCDVKPEIWVEAAFSGVPMIAVSLFKPTAFDLITERFRGWKIGKKKRRFVADDILEGRKVKLGKFGWAVFELGEWAERIGWYMLVIDVGLDFAVNWTSMAYQWSGCRVPGSPYAAVGAYDRLSRPVAGTYATNWDTLAEVAPCFASPDGVGVNAGVVATPTISVSADGPPEPYPAFKEWTFQLVDILGSWRGDPITIIPGRNGPGYGQALYKDWGGLGGTKLYVLYTLYCDGFLVSNSTLRINGYVDGAIGWDP